MPLVKVLNRSEIREFDRPLELNSREREKFFRITKKIRSVLEKLRTRVNKVGFLIQLGYFRSTGRFFKPGDFHKQDIEYACIKLGIDPVSMIVTEYERTIAYRHRLIILDIQRSTPFDQQARELLEDEAFELVAKQQRPRLILHWLTVFLRKKRIEVPPYYTLAEIITKCLNANEKELVTIVRENLTSENKKLLVELLQVDTPDSERNRKRYPLTSFKKINQSTRPKKVAESVQYFLKLQEAYLQLKPVLDALNLSTEVLRYYATYTSRAQIYQVKRFSANKRYLHMIVFVAHQYFTLHDTLMDVLINCVQSAINSARKLYKERYFDSRKSRQHTVDSIFTSVLEVMDQPYDLIEDTLSERSFSQRDKLSVIEDVVVSQKQNRRDIRKQIVKLQQENTRNARDEALHEILEEQSVKLQNRVAEIVKHMVLDPQSPNRRLIRAIDYFKDKDGQLDKNAPLSFLDKDDQERVFDETGRFRISLYKVMLFRDIMGGVKSGSLNMRDSLKYKSLEEYQIPQKTWQDSRDQLIERASMTHLLDFDKVIGKLANEVDKRIVNANENVLSGANEYVKFNTKDAYHVATPPVEKDYDIDRLPDLFNKVHYTSVLEILSTVNEQAHFLDAFDHFSSKYNRSKPDPKSFFAVIVALGCNVGINKIKKIAKGLSRDDLDNIINWYFSQQNMNSASDKIMAFTSKLDVVNLLKKDPNKSHTSSDGQKYGVGVASLNANFSYKYFGKGIGVTDNTFIDDRLLMWHSNVFSSSEREAPYVIDGLTYCDNDTVIKSDMHSTDTHGYTETIFGTSYMLGYTFAPRIKNVQKQRIYSFKPRKEYKDKDYKILPYGRINIQLIKEHWEDILRFIATIKLKETRASQLFKRLNGYSKKNPFYKALKEFGKIIKSIFILHYIDDVQLRQAIEKQLNKGELSNKFAKAVFFANNQELQSGIKEDQEIAMACKRLIQNIVVCWNYTYLSQLLVDAKSKAQKKELIEIIKHGSAITWQHVNFFGEYDFTDEVLRKRLQFALAKIRALKVA